MHAISFASHILFWALVTNTIAFDLPAWSSTWQKELGTDREPRGQNWISTEVPLAQSDIGNGGVGRLPALGFNSWNEFKCDISEAKFLDAAKKLVALGLKDVGYEYVNIDDCWSVKDKRDTKTGYMIPDTAKFPQGISGLATKIHNMGLKIGIYSSAGQSTCAAYPASLEHEDTDVKSFAEWGVDYLKYDNCNYGESWKDECEFCQTLNTTCKDTSDTKYCPKDFDYSKTKTAERFNRMRSALDAQKRPILYSLCQWGKANVNTWAKDVGQSWRTTDDINPSWGSILSIINQNTFALRYADFYSHPDADMLEIGNGLTHEEERTHFALWAAMKSPLLIGTDLTRIKPSSVAILKSKTLLEFNQDDYYGKPAVPFRWGTNKDWTYDDEHPAEYWSGHFKSGIMILLFNNHDSERDMNFQWSEIPRIDQSRQYRVVDGWDGKSYGCYDAKGAIVVPRIKAHDTAVLVLKNDGCPTVRVPRIWPRRGLGDSLDDAVVLQS